MNYLRLIVIVFAVTCGDLANGEEEWGDLRGRFILNGTPPATEHIKITKDRESLGELVENESLLIHPENQGIANVVVYLLPMAKDGLRVHPSYDDTSRAKVELKMDGGRFVPHILLLRTSQIMVQANEDPVFHHARISLIRNAPM